MSEPTFCLPSRFLAFRHSCVIHRSFIDNISHWYYFLNYLIAVIKRALARCSAFTPLHRERYSWFLHRESYSLSRGRVILQDLPEQNPALKVRAETRHTLHFSQSSLTLSLFPFPLAQMIIYIYLYIVHSAYLSLSADCVSKKKYQAVIFFMWNFIWVQRTAHCVF